MSFHLIWTSDLWTNQPGSHRFLHLLSEGKMSFHLIWTSDLWTNRPGSHRFLHLLSAVLALVFFARRIQPFLFLVNREVELCVVCCFSHSAHWLPTRLARWPIPLVVCSTGEKEKKVWQQPPPLPPPLRARCSFGKNKKIKKSRGASTCLGATQVGVTQGVSVRLASVQGFLRLVG